jgi:hypothetical protein
MGTKNLIGNSARIFVHWHLCVNPLQNGSYG